MIIKAGSSLSDILRKFLAAIGKRKRFFYRLQNIACDVVGRIGAEIFIVTRGALINYRKSGICRVGKLDIRITAAILQFDVIARLELLYKLVFLQQCFKLGQGVINLEIIDRLNHSLGFSAVVGIGGKIA